MRIGLARMLSTRLPVVCALGFGLLAGQALAQGEAAAAGVNLVSDGGFERPSVASDQTFTAGQGIGAWTVVAGSVDIAAASFWQPAAGSQSLDVSGNAAGAIAQDLATTPGQTYTLAFEYAADPKCGPNVKTLKVVWGGVTVATLHPTDVGHSTTNMGWKPYAARVAASATLTRLEFVSLTNTACGPVIDEVSVT